MISVIVILVEKYIAKRPGGVKKHVFSLAIINTHSFPKICWLRWDQKYTSWWKSAGGTSCDSEFLHLVQRLYTNSVSSIIQLTSSGKRSEWSNVLRESAIKPANENTRTTRPSVACSILKRPSDAEPGRPFPSTPNSQSFFPSPS